MSRNFFLETDVISEVCEVQRGSNMTRFEFWLLWLNGSVIVYEFNSVLPHMIQDKTPKRYLTESLCDSYSDSNSNDELFFFVLQHFCFIVLLL